MARDTCRYPSCERAPDSDKIRGFCSDACEVKFDQIMSDVPRGPQERGIPGRDLPETDPPDAF